MAAAPVSNSPAPSEFSSEKLKHNIKSTEAATAVADSLNNVDNPYLKELQKSLRNALKKLNATAKLDAILAENPGKSLDELVDQKKINLDQKNQALKKPALQATVAQIEGQVAHYREFAAQCEERLAHQKAEIERSHKAELENIRAQAKADASESTEKDFRRRLLSLSKFLCAAAAMRRSGDETSSESRAFEGVLYQVYGGSQEAVDSMTKLIGGADEKIVSVEGETLAVTYGKVKQVSEDYAPTTEEEPTEAAAGTDPTVAHAGYTELQDTSNGAPDTSNNEQATDAPPSSKESGAPPAQTLVSNAANPVAEANWDANAATSMTSSANTDGWVEVQRDPAETETGLQATPAAADAGLQNNHTAPEAANESAENAAVPKSQGGNEFEPVVHHHQRQPSFRGRGRGRGRGGEGFRGRGRGDFRGRGRGSRGGGRGRGGPNGAPAAAPAPAQ